MNKFFVAFIMLVFCVVANAETTPEASRSSQHPVTMAKNRCYIELKAQQGGYNVNNVKVTINIGKMLSTRTGYSNGDISKVIPMTSMIDALNALSHYGWRLAETYSNTVGPQVVTQYWILYKDVENVDDVFSGMFPEK